MHKKNKIIAVSMAFILAFVSIVSICERIQIVKYRSNIFTASISIKPIEADAITEIVDNLASNKIEKDENIIVDEVIEIVEETSTNEQPLSITEEEIELLALVTIAEAEGECEEGKRLVIDVILNRVDSGRFGDTIHEVIFAPNQFSSMWNGRVDRCNVTDEVRQLVIEELENRTSYEVLYFRTMHYHTFGTPLFQVGNHYFSK